ncbi:MAG: hypothetical protein JWM25_106 [Thermoleophilia bacterium]|nr:hypothetical protein [Thermoleophilia bacterium]
MDLFAPENLPGVGMGDLESIVAVLGMIGLAVTSGALIAQGTLGTILFVISGIAVLQEKPDFGGSTPAALVIFGFLLVAVAARTILEMRATREEAGVAGLAKDSKETKQLVAAVERRRRMARALTFLAVLWGGAAVGFAWAEWNEVPFRLEDAEAIIGLGLGLLVAAIGGDAAWRFLSGALRAGGSALVVGIVVVVIAYLLNVASFYIPFVGIVPLLLAIWLAIRLRRRAQQKYAGLRILS